MVNWDWDASPTYESERLRIDICAPLVTYDMKLPRQVQDDEVALMLSAAEHRLNKERPLLVLVRHHRGTGVISGTHRKRFADWIEEHGGRLDRPDVAVVIVMPEAIFRAVLRVVYRFRSPPLRTVTTPDPASAVEAARQELGAMGLDATPEIDRLLHAFAA